VARHGGIVPAVRRRALLALTLREREEISPGLASGSSFRELAKCLERAVVKLHITKQYKPIKDLSVFYRGHVPKKDYACVPFGLTRSRRGRVETGRSLLLPPMR
jgi:hypothetical protein